MSLLNDKLYWKKGFKISLPSFVISCLFIKKHGQELKNERKEQGKFLRWFLLNNLHNHYTGGSTNNKVNSDIISIVKNTMPSTTIQDLILNMKCNEQIDKSLFGIVEKDKTGTYEGNYFDPWKITVLSQMCFMSAAQLKAKDWYEDFQIEKHSKLELHHVFPKAQFNNETYKYYKKLINHISNLAIITRTTNRKIKDKLAEDYLFSISRSKKGKIELKKQGIKIYSKKELYKRDKFLNFVWIEANF